MSTSHRLGSFVVTSNVQRSTLRCFEFDVCSLGRLFFSDVAYLVIDEADSMFDDTFKSETMKLLETISVSIHLHSFFFIIRTFFIRTLRMRLTKI